MTEAQEASAQVRATESTRRRRPLAALAKLALGAAPAPTLALILLALLGGLLPSAMAYVVQRLVDEVVRAQRGEAGAPMVWLYAQGAMMVLYIAQQRSGVALHRVLALRLGEELRRRMLDTMAALRLDDALSPALHEQLDLARRQVNTRPLAAIQHGLGVFRGAVLFVSAGLLLLSVSPRSVAAVLLGAVPVLGAQLRFGMRMHALVTAQVVARREQGYLENVLTREGFAAELRAHGFAHVLRARHRAMGDAIAESESRLLRKEALVLATLSGVASVFVYASYVDVVAQAALGATSVGALAMALAVLRQTQNALQSLLADAGGLTQDRLYVADMMAMAELATADDPKEHPTGSLAELVFDDVAYAYPGSSSAALHGVSFRAMRGELIGLVGASGSGKTTLLRLALGLISPTSGKVLGGTGSPKTAVVFQDYARYKLSVRDGLALAEPAASDDALRAALSKSAALGTVDALPEGLDTRLGRSFPGGVDLSGGQWQKLALARAFLREGAQLRVFDEPSSALDPESEAAVFSAIEACKDDAITLVAAHRLAALRGADRILVLEDGKIVEQGTHEALMELDGRYATLFRLQGRPYAE